MKSSHVAQQSIFSPHPSHSCTHIHLRIFQQAGPWHEKRENGAQDSVCPLVFRAANVVIMRKFQTRDLLQTPSGSFVDRVNKKKFRTFPILLVNSNIITSLMVYSVSWEINFFSDKINLNKVSKRFISRNFWAKTPVFPQTAFTYYIHITTSLYIKTRYVVSQQAGGSIFF